MTDKEIIAELLAALKHVEATLVTDARQHGAYTLLVEEVKIIRAAIAKVTREP
jgi:hypothetical protein